MPSGRVFGIDLSQNMLGLAREHLAQFGSRVRLVGFVEVETSVEAAPAVRDHAEQYDEFVRNIILRRHLENIPTEDLRAEYLAT